MRISDWSSDVCSSDLDKAAVAGALQAQGIGHTIDPVTGALTVDADKLYQARIALAGQGLPKAQPSGDSLIASLPMGASRAIEGETLRAAREADLSRTIEAIDAVRSARIHIAAAEPSLFVRDDKPATASVMLTLQNGRSQPDGLVQAIRFLRASAVPGVSAEPVSVIDQRRPLFSHMGAGGSLQAFKLPVQYDAQSLPRQHTHPTSAEPTLSARDDMPATASCMLTLQNGRSLSDGQVQAIRFLVASSVPGMSADHVSVIDQRGALLSDSATSGDMQAFQLQTQMEDRFRRALDTLLGPMLGAGNYTVEVHADVHMSERSAEHKSELQSPMR